ncbi:endonuclease/exonuclease/phosphatase family protein [uncultured Jatrophihabitans sp.]|uniref:endonuclease/exonuclease/phosphatase family protein n=1 Tax=uncultured Jatrophihabitans sp. TaxID=1610747 RepID=UPI0035CC59CA
MRRIRGLVATGTVALTAAGLACAVAPPAQAAPSHTVVVSEAYGGGGNSGATLKNDFIELQNVQSTAQDLSGYSVQYLSAAPSASSSWQATPLSGSAPASGHYLVQEAAGTGGTADLPTPDATGTINISGTGGTVALVRGTTPLTCKTTADCANDTSILDLVGWNGAAVHEGTAAAPTTNTTSVQRAAAGTDTDDNSADFTVATPTPQNSGAGSTGGGGTPTPGSTRIHDIQGSSFVSPLDGSTVTNVPGIVTALRTSGSKGFWFQDPTPDTNSATSEGVFVYTSSAPTVQPGDSVLVSGTVDDYYPLASGDSASTTSNLSVTEISKPTETVLSSGNALPAALVLGPDTVPDTYAPDLGGKNIENTPITPSRSALDFFESVEGMRVEVDDARVVGPSDSYGEQYVTTKPNQDRTYRGGTELLGENQTPSGRLEVVPLTGPNLGLDVGDVLQGATVGPLDYSLYGGYDLAASTVGTVQHNGLAPVTATAASKKQLSIATYNVENLSPKDPQTKFDALAKGVVTNLATPDIVALEEIQDNDGPTDDGVVAADQTLNQLTSAIIAAGGPHYDYREIDPVNDSDGGQPGGNIRVAFLYNPALVTFVDAGSPSTNRSTNGTDVVKKHGQPALTLSPGRIDPTNPVWNSSRKPLVGQFTFRGKNVFVVANHFDAKLGDQNADGRYQYPAQASATQRAGQAQVVHDFVAKLLAVDKGAQVAVVGDLNDYQFSPALAALRTGTADGSGKAILTDLITGLPVDQQYTYVYDGVSQVLDHILVTPKVRGVQYQVVHVNAEFHDQVSDHDPQVLDFVP